MTHVSKIKLNKIKEKELIRNFDLVLTKITSYPDMESFLGSLLTPTERIMLVKRLAIVVLLKEGIPQMDISRALCVTQATVSRMQLFLEAKGDIGYTVALRQLENEKILQEFKKLLLGLVKYSIRAAGGYVKPTII